MGESGSRSVAASAVPCHPEQSEGSSSRSDESPHLIV
jgi:hypothetical protein